LFLLPPPGLLVVVACLALTGCAADGADATSGTVAAEAAGAGTAADPQTSGTSGEPRTGTVALLSGAETVVHATPATTGAVVARLSARTVLGSARVLLVDPARANIPGWVPVLLPVRPNGATGWVAAGDVRLQSTADRIVVDLAARQVHLQLGGRPETVVPVAVGSAQTPTPTGEFFVTDRVVPSDPRGAYGAFALGLSAHSATLQSFGDGDAQIGFHGTDQPASIGHPVTHGCIRLPAAAVAMLAEVALGTPVTIR
jgi:lipoprotein-anchoring transpeptidase ErfK/SrfK